MRLEQTGDTRKLINVNVPRLFISVRPNRAFDNRLGPAYSRNNEHAIEKGWRESRLTHIIPMCAATHRLYVRKKPPTYRIVLFLKLVISFTNLQTMTKFCEVQYLGLICINDKKLTSICLYKYPHLVSNTRSVRGMRCDEAPIS